MKFDAKNKSFNKKLDQSLIEFVEKAFFLNFSLAKKNLFKKKFSLKMVQMFGNLTS